MLPAHISESADAVFGDIAAQIKKHCLVLQNAEVEKDKMGVTLSDLTGTTIEAIHKQLKFLDDRASEVSAFLFLID